MAFEQNQTKQLGPEQLIAPCGMNCALCQAHQRSQNKCPGCRGDDRHKPKTRIACKIKLCPHRKDAQFCGSCGHFPCKALRRLNHRYRAKYAMSMIENLMRIEEFGLTPFVKRERLKWACPGCGALLCVHANECLNCLRPWR